MKKIYWILLILLFFYILTSFKTYKVSLDMPLVGKIIYLDAGHGGIDQGAVYKDIEEKDINLSIVLKLRDALEKRGAVVYLTRDSDFDLANKNAKMRKRSDLGNRAYLINKSDASLYISIHLNSYPSNKWSGAQVFYTLRNSKNKLLAEKMQGVFKDKLNSNREFKEIKNMYMYDRVTKPGILIEAGFLSNSSDRNKLLSSDYQDKLADVIIDGLNLYFVSY